MLTLLALGVALALPVSADTVMPVSRGDALALETPSGSVTVQVWGRDQVQLQGGGSLRRTGRTLRLDGRSARTPRHETLTVTVPAWLDVSLEGRELDVSVDGVSGSLRVRTLSGEVWLTRIAGETDVRSVSGEVTVRGISGRTSLWTVEGDVDVADGTGTLMVQSTDGDLVLQDIAADELSAETTDGDVLFGGSVPRGARLRLATHDGDITATIPRNADVEVSVSTFDGAFEPAMPVQTRGLRAGEALMFVIGRGGATLSMQAFDGDIRLRHAVGDGGR